MTRGEAVSVLRERRFAWYFAARTVSTAGTAMAPVALAFAVLHLTDSAGALAQVLTARTAAMVLFLASDDARLITGHEYFVDAGWR